MIKKEELKLGNWVKIPELEYYNDEEDFSCGFARITKLEEFELNTDSLKEINYNEVECIPLSEELLLKLNFRKEEKLNNPGINEYYYDTRDFSIYINLSEDNSCKMSVENKNNTHKATVEIHGKQKDINPICIHQLQNLLIECNIINFDINLN